MTKLSVNINKIATLRNARGGNMPDLLQFALDVEQLGGQGITVHPRPDERHIRYQDVRDLKKKIHTEFNIEGNPTEDFIRLVEEVVPTQVTLVPDAPDAITSNKGWNIVQHEAYLRQIVERFHQSGIRVSIFIDPQPEQAFAAKQVGADRVELYTEAYARNYPIDKEAAIESYVLTAEAAQNAGLDINAGHDLSLDNLGYLIDRIPYIAEVSIGHALICESLYLGIAETLRRYRDILDKKR